MKDNDMFIKTDTNFSNENLIIDKIVSSKLYSLNCSECGWKNSTPQTVVRECPVCGKDLLMLNLEVL